MTRDAWLGQLQDMLREAIADAPDEVCRELAERFWDETAQPLRDEMEDVT